MTHSYSFQQAVLAPVPANVNNPALLAMSNTTDASAIGLFAYREAGADGTNKLQSHATEGSA